MCEGLGGMLARRMDCTWPELRILNVFASLGVGGVLILSLMDGWIVDTVASQCCEQ